MNTSAIIQAMPIIEELIAVAPMAIGGYSSLVMQGILKDTRDTKDIDLCIFSGTKYGKPEYRTISLMSDKVGDTCCKWTQLLRSCGWTGQFISRANRTGANSPNGFFSFDEPPRPEELEQNIRLKDSTGLQRSASIVVVCGARDEPITLPTSVLGIPPCRFPFGMAQRAKEFFQDQNIIAIDIDLFLFQFEKFNQITVEINGQRFVHYYIILKAKYEYCLNKLTDEKAFDKHIDDLRQSFEVKHIRGVNFPEDIEFLINRRNEEK